jgi:hypothetical protein
MSQEEFEVYKPVVEKTIRLDIKKNEFGLSGYEFDDGKIVVTVLQKTYDKLEEETRKLGLTVDEALANILYGHLKRLSDC